MGQRFGSFILVYSLVENIVFLLRKLFHTTFEFLSFYYSLSLIVKRGKITYLFEFFDETAVL